MNDKKKEISQEHSSSANLQPTASKSANVSRRNFLGRVGGLTAAAMATGAIALEPALGSKTSEAQAKIGIALTPQERRNAALQIRRDAAQARRRLPLPRHLDNGDEIFFANRIGSYSKALPHNALGEVDAAAYNAFLHAVTTGRTFDFEAIPLGGTAKLACPLGGQTFSLDGVDSHATFLATPPTFSSAWEAGEMVELYWQALTRDIHFANYNNDPLINQAAAELSHVTDFRGPKSGGAVTPGTLFRGETAGDLTGPYISQFLWKDIPYGAHTIMQKYRVPNANDNHMTSYSDWLNILRGGAPTTAISFDPTPRYIRNGSDLGAYVHSDFSYQGYLNAALILLSFGGAAVDPNNPYRTLLKQGSFVNFGGPHILDLVAKAALEGLKAAWFHKWYVHRRLRPEVFSGRVHNHLTGAKTYPIHADVLDSQGADAVFSRHGTYLLPMAFPEGSPTHPAYPAGHAVIAGACATVLKAFFNESFVIPSPVEASADGLTLNPFTGGNLTVGGELNKLAANIAIGRDTAGVHWRTDGVEGLRLGEQVGISLLEDEFDTHSEDFIGFNITKFDGSFVTI